MPLLSGPPIGHDAVVQPMVEEVIHDVHCHGRAAGIATGPLKGVSPFVVETTGLAIFEAHPAKRRQYSWRELGIQGFERRAQRQWEDLLQIRHSLRAVEPLMQGLWGQHGGRVALPAHVTEPSSRHCRVVQHVRRHQGHNVLTSYCAAGPLNNMTLTGQGH
jgi:hypothetical protein